MPTITGVTTDIDRGLYRTSWTFTTTGDGLALDAAHLSDKSVQVVETLTCGNTIVIRGSNDAIAVSASGNWGTLTAPGGTGLTITGVTGASAVFQILENPQFISPLVTTISCGTITVNIVAQSARR